MFKNVSELSRIIYFSDGSGAQYKNRFNVCNLLHHESDFNVPAEWHYFASAHGKGPSDGLGGTLKRLAAKASLQGSEIQCAKELYEWAARNTNLNVVYISAEECIKQKELLKSRFDAAVAIPGIRSYHSVSVDSDHSIKMKITSLSNNSKIFTLKKPIRKRAHPLQSKKRKTN